MKELLDVCSSYKYGNDMGLERLSNQSKIIFINIRILLLLSTEEVKHIVLDFRRFGSFPEQRLVIEPNPIATA